jgi:hypothetical protein
VIQTIKRGAAMRTIDAIDADWLAAITRPTIDAREE